MAGSIESLIGGLDDDQLNANDGNGIIDGGGGNDSLNGGLGADTADRRRRAWTPPLTAGTRVRST